MLIAVVSFVEDLSACCEITLCICKVKHWYVLLANEAVRTYCELCASCKHGCYAASGCYRWMRRHWHTVYTHSCAVVCTLCKCWRRSSQRQSFVQLRDIAKHLCITALLFMLKHVCAAACSALQALRFDRDHCNHDVSGTTACKSKVLC
jgi:hypothetical protein